MRVGVIGSMNFAERMVAVRDKLIEQGHDAFLASLTEPMLGKTEEEKEVIKLQQEQEDDPIKEFWDLMQGAEAVVVCNYDKKGVKNYIGGNTLMEIGFAHVLGQKIFLINPIPDIPYYKAEIDSVKPVILHGDLAKVK